jgi:Xaa-Pro aminopeptidase
VNRFEEIEVKRKRVHDFMEEQGLDAVILENQSSFAWYTGGGDNHVGIATERGSALLVITRDADVVVTSNIEAPRVMMEEVPGLGLELAEVPWHERGGVMKAVERLAGKGKAASDTGFAGSAKMAGELAELRFSLTEAEMERYRKVGRDTEESVRSVCKRVEPGMTEHAIAGMVAEELYFRGVTPVVLLIAADDRIEKYRHPINTNRKVNRYVMVVSCGRRWGLIVSCTRIVHFGNLPAELRRKHDAVLKVDAALNLSTVVGAEIGSVLQAGIEAYGAVRFPEEWQMHHQGGPTGYAPREFRAMIGEKRQVVGNQAFAWNPSIAGTKSEDTILVRDEGVEFLSLSPDWPMVEVEYGGAVVQREDILVVWP